MAQYHSFYFHLSQYLFHYLRLWYHDVIARGDGKVIIKDHHEVNGCEWMVLYKKRDVMEKWIWEDEKMKEYPADDGQME